jgi:hypothetical protein
MYFGAKLLVVGTTSHELGYYFRPAAPQLIKATARPSLAA